MRSHPPTESAPLRTTLLDLVTRLTDVTADEDETVRAALALLDSGQAELTGNFRGQRLALPGGGKRPGPRSRSWRRRRKGWT